MSERALDPILTAITLEQMAVEIRSLRREREILTAKVEVIDTFGRLIGLAASRGGIAMTEDVAWRGEELAKELRAFAERQKAERVRAEERKEREAADPPPPYPPRPLNLDPNARIVSVDGRPVDHPDRGWPGDREQRDRNGAARFDNGHDGGPEPLNPPFGVGRSLLDDTTVVGTHDHYAQGKG